jgi:Ca2+-binding RTX toxin-like protein
VSVVVESGFASQARAATQSTVMLEPNSDGPNTKTLHYQALVNRTNEVTVKLMGANYIVIDANVVNSDGNCGSNSGGTWTCSAGEVTKIAIDLDAGNDTADLCQLGPSGFCASGVEVDATVDGGNGRDELTSAGGISNGTTVLIGGSGKDTMTASHGGSTIVSYAESWRTDGVTVHLPYQIGTGSDLDTFGDNGEPGENDVLNGAVNGVIGGPGDDLLVGSFLNNTFEGGGGADTIAGLDGTDTMSYGDHATAVNASADTAVSVFTDAVTGRPEVTVGGNPAPGDGAAGEHDSIGEDVENISGGSGNDTLVGSHWPPSWSGVLNGGTGNDTLSGGPGPDLLEGGPGFDTASYASDLDPSRSEPVKVTIAGSADDGSPYDQVDPLFPGPRDTVSSDVESVVGSSGDDTLSGGSNADTILGGAGIDTIDGAGGNDTLSGGNDGDTVRGAGGDDTVNGDGGDDSLSGGDGSDSLGGGDGDDTLDGNAGSDGINGGNGTDAADYSSRLSDLSVSADGNAGDGETGENDSVGADVEGIGGGAGNDLLRGNGGAGSFSGGAGSDTLDGGGGADLLRGDSGFDTVDYSSRSAAVSVNLGSPGSNGGAGENDTIPADIERVVGGSAGDTLIGGPAADALEGGPGNDAVSGAGGQDKLDGDAGDDGLDGSEGNDTLGGGADSDALNGGEGADALSGDDGVDTLAGGAGADTLSGGTGDDSADYSAYTGALNISFDGVGNDGLSGEADNIESDVEGLVSGSGNDQIDSSDGNNGRIDCGPGDDTLASDPGDRSIDCESGGAQVGISGSRVRMSNSGSVAIRVVCPGAALNPCAGILILQSGAKAGAARKAGALGRLGRGRFTIAPGKAKRITIKLSNAARRTIRRRGKLRARATASAGGLGTVSQSIIISAASRTGKG